MAVFFTKNNLGYGSMFDEHYWSPAQSSSIYFSENQEVIIQALY